MQRVRLEIDRVTIHRPKERWRLYFVVLAEHPSEEDNMVLTTFPQEPFRLSHRHGNKYSFDTNDPGAEGLFVLSREMPSKRELNVHIYLRHTRKATRHLGGILQEVEQGIGNDALGIVEGILGAATVPWLVIAKKAVPLVGKILMQIPDRDFGFVSAFERFGEEFTEQGEVDREKPFTGDASLVYSWSVDA